MEINRLDGRIFGVVATQDIVEGRFGLLTTHSVDTDFGSDVDLPGVKLPSTEEEAKRAKFAIAFAEDNRPTPIYDSMPSFPFAMRRGYDQVANVPFTSLVRLTHPGNQIGQTIASGTRALAMGEGTFTVYSGHFIANASLKAGAPVSVSYSGADAGKLQYQATWDDSVVGVVEEFDSSANTLTVTTMHF